MQSMKSGNVIVEPVNPASDIEWMLQSNQVTDSALLQALVHRYYAWIYCLAGFLLYKKNSQEETAPAALRASVEQALLSIVKNRHRYWGDPELSAWIFGLALCAIQKTNQTAGNRNPPDAPAVLTENQLSPTDRDLEMAVAALDQRQRQLLFLRYRLELSIPGIGHVLRMKQTTVTAHLQTLSDDLRPLLEDELHQDLPEPPAAQADLASADRFETLISNYLAASWPSSTISAADENFITGETVRLLDEGDFRRKLARHAREITVVGLIILVVAGLGWAMKITAPNPNQTVTAQPGFAQTLMANEGVTPTLSLTAAPALPAPLAVGEKTMLTIHDSAFPTHSTPLNNQVQSTLPLTGALSYKDSGFASLDAVLRFWGSDASVTPTLASSTGEVNAFSYEMVNAVSDQTDLKALLRVGGDVDTLKRFLVGGFPIIIARGFDAPLADGGSGWLGAYIVINGFDGVQQRFTFLDSSQVPAKTAEISYSALERQWRAFDYLYLVIYPPGQTEKVNQLLGSQADIKESYRQAAEKASMDAYASIYARDQFFAWFNRGANLAYLNDKQGAATAFDQAFSLYQKTPPAELPEQIIWYQTSFFRVYYETGRYQEMIDLAAMIISSPRFPQIEECYYWRALAEETLGDKTTAMQDLRVALRLNPNFYPAIARLENLLKGG
jgi:DNA-directed RNA polymerase specialized sigma24 family protein